MKDAVYGKAPTERDIKGQQMAPPLFQPDKWEEMNLVLPKTNWPEHYNAYTVSKELIDLYPQMKG